MTALVRGRMVVAECEGLCEGLRFHGILSPPSHFLTSYKHSHIFDV